MITDLYDGEKKFLGHWTKHTYAINENMVTLVAWNIELLLFWCFLLVIHVGK